MSISKIFYFILILGFSSCQSPANVEDVNDKTNVADNKYNCRQILLSISEDENSKDGILLLKEQIDGVWKNKNKPFAVSYGKNGLAWGIGLHKKEKGPQKKEGDLCSPAGIFKIGKLFGQKAFNTNCAYVHIDENMQCIEDLKSSHYNDIIDNTKIKKDWDSKDLMQREDELYKYGFLVEHNPEDIPGNGSCIFFHLWSEIGKPTAGCTAMEENDLKTVLQFLDCSKNPLLIQCNKQDLEQVLTRNGFLNVLIK